MPTDDETPYLLPNGDRVWVIKTSVAAELLSQMLERFRLGHADPLIFGDAGQPEAVVVPFELWQALDTRVFDKEGFDTTHALTRHRLKNDPGNSIPLEDIAAELGLDLSPIDDAELHQTSPNRRDS
jgi:hypothetical protein